MKSLTAGKLLRVVIWMVWLSACAPVTAYTQPNTAVNVPSPTVPAPAATPNTPLPLRPTDIPPTDLPSNSASTEVPGLAPANPSIPVRIDEPQDDAVVQASLLQIKGEANPGTVLSINDEIVLVDSSRKFSAQIQLDEGLNVIEIIASDDQGNQESRYLSITYEP